MPGSTTLGVAKMSAETCDGGTRDPARLLGIGDHRRSHGRFGFGDRVRIKAGPKIVGQSESGQIEAVVAGALELRERRPPASVRPVSLTHMGV